MIKPMVVVLALQGVGSTLGDGCGILKHLQFQGSEMSLGLFQDFLDGYVRFSISLVKHTVVVMTTGSQSRRSQIEYYG